ncbi:MAG: SAM-dependent methyltransferase, partial [Deltaproteobacteria bacterium]|nr:SAM-dependent methyltransferase [Deltaproteobacteria bacterium]
MAPQARSLPYAGLIFAVSASVLGYEILLMRLLSISFWHHFASMIVSIALLGFGGSGSLLFLLFHRIRRHLDGWLIALAGMAALSYERAFSLSQGLKLDPLQLIWRGSEWFRMAGAGLLMSLPFLFAGAMIGIILTAAGDRAHRMYGMDLLGAGCGAVAVAPALYLMSPQDLLPFLGGLVLLGALGVCSRLKRPVRGVGGVLGILGLLVLIHALAPPRPVMHPSKALPMTLSLPDARTEAVRVGPLGRIDVVGSALIRHAPGLSLHFGLDPGMSAAGIPEQKGIFVDGEGPSPITRFNGDPATLEFLDYTSLALPYHVRRPRSVLVAGAGGGMDVLLALKHHVPEILALEADRQIAALVSGPFAGFSGGIYQHPGVTLAVREARQYLHACCDRFDLLQFSLLDTFAAAAGGLASGAENYLYTVEAFRLYLSRLSDRGMIAVTRWLKLPPRDSFRVTATAVRGLRETGLSHPENHLLFIRSWKTSTILISRSPFTGEEIGRALRFCEKRGFDVAYYPGMGREAANRFDLLEAPYYFLGAKALCGPGAEPFLKGYVFDVSPTTDDRPYFAHFFRWDRAGELVRHLHREWLPMVESGYILIVATLVQAAVFGTLLILFPLLFLKRAGPYGKAAASPVGTRNTLFTMVYFGSIGLGFLFMEMALFPKYTLLLSHPITSAAVVLSAMLVFAGLGSLSVRGFQDRGPRFIWIPVAAIGAWVLLDALFWEGL